MRVEVLPDADAVARRGAALIAAAARAAVAARGRFILGLSGGSTPWGMLERLAEEEAVPWCQVHIVQVDERVAPAGSGVRNLTRLREGFFRRVPLAPERIHEMPVEAADLGAAASAYARTLGRIAGSPPVLDVVHLGLGPDGHTASLVPDDGALETTDAEVAVTGIYEGHRRMTLTRPAIDRARQRLWLVTGAGKSEMLIRLRAGDATIPAGRIRREGAVVLADAAAGGG